MSKPEPYTAAELAEALRAYGDMPVVVMTVDPNDNETDPIVPIRLEIGNRHLGVGNFYVAITAYETEPVE